MSMEKADLKAVRRKKAKKTVPQIADYRGDC